MSEHAPTSNLPLWASVSPPPTPARAKSRTSREAAGSIKTETIGKRREHVYLTIAASDSGLARFQIADRMGVADHWITSSVDALIKAGRIAESPDRMVLNPRSGKRCAVLELVRRHA